MAQKKKKKQAGKGEIIAVSEELNRFGSGLLEFLT